MFLWLFFFLCHFKMRQEWHHIKNIFRLFFSVSFLRYKKRYINIFKTYSYFIWYYFSLFNDITVRVQPGHWQKSLSLKPVHIAEHDLLKPAQSREHQAPQGLQVKKCSVKNSPRKTRSAATCWYLNGMQVSKQRYTGFEALWESHCLSHTGNMWCLLIWVMCSTCLYYLYCGLNIMITNFSLWSCEVKLQLIVIWVEINCSRNWLSFFHPLSWRNN